MSIRRIIPEIILASKSDARKMLLNKFNIDFRCLPADIDETPLDKETPLQLVERLSISKARTVYNRLLNKEQSKQPEGYLLISSDQVAVLDNKVYGKPGDFNKAYEQLKIFNNNTIEFITGLCILYCSCPKQQEIDFLEFTQVTSKVKLKNLSDEQIIKYIKVEQPYQCAASIKVEGLGISLIDEIKTPDFNAIIGLPLLELTKILEKYSLDILSWCK